MLTLDKIFVREFNPDKDYGMVSRWWASHGGAVPRLELLPRVGMIATSEDNSEDYAAIWLYMDNSVGLSFAEHAVTCPRLSLISARNCFVRLIDYLKELCSVNDYGILSITTYPAIAKVLLGTDLGFKTDNKHCVTLSCATR